MTITLKAARTNVGMTQEEAAQKIGVAVSTLSSWENGAKIPSSRWIDKICDAYCVKYDNINWRG